MLYISWKDCVRLIVFLFKVHTKAIDAVILWSYVVFVFINDKKTQLSTVINWVVMQTAL